MKDLTKYNYNEQVERMTNLLKDAQGWGDGYDSSMGQTLIQLVADMTDNLHFMLERRTIENYITTARSRNAILARANELGYRPKRIIANSGKVLFKLYDDAGVPQVAVDEIIIPQFTEFTYDEQTFVSTTDVVLDIGEGEVEIPVMNGSFEEMVIPLGQFEQTNHIIMERNFETIEENSLSVKSNGDEFFDVRRERNGNPARRAMSFLSPDDSFYDIRYAYDGLRVILGDGNFGKKPTSDITLSYVRTNSIESPLLTLGNELETDFEVVGYTVMVTNSTQIRGGKPVESLNTIKEKATAYHSTNGRAVTNDDISFWVKESNIGGIIDAVSIGEHELNTVIHNLNNVYISYLKEDGTKLTIEEEKALRKFLGDLMLVTVYPVIREVDKVFVEFILEARKDPTLEMSDTEFYTILRNFVNSYFKLRDGSIGREIQHSEVIKDLHKIIVRRDGIDYNLVDYVKLEMNLLFPFNVPVENKSVLINFDEDYEPVTGQEFALILQNIPCVVQTDVTDTHIDIMTKMRDEIMDKTPFIARVQIENLLVDGFGNTLPVDIDIDVGSGMLIGAETPYTAPNVTIEPPAIGSAIAKVVLLPEELQVQHFYYNSLAGRRPLIPLRESTSIDFVAPSDTDVNVYGRTVMDDPASESLFGTVTAGTAFTETFTGLHSVQFEYVNNSTETIIVDITYDGVQEFDYGLIIETKDGFGSFILDKNAGDISSVIKVDFNVNVPVESRVVLPNVRQVLRESLQIINLNGGTLFNTLIDGRFITPLGTISQTGRVNYFSGRVTLPESLPAGEYYFRYKQNKFQNIKTDNNTAPVLLPISNNASTPNKFSKIEVANG